MNVEVNSAGGISVFQYVGHTKSGKSSLWIGENVNQKTGVVMDVAPNTASAFVTNITPIVLGQGAVVTSIQKFDPTWAAGGGLDVVPLMNWNPKDVVHIPYS